MDGLEGTDLRETIVNIRNYLGNPADLKELSDGVIAILYFEGLVKEEKLRTLLHDPPSTFEEITDIVLKELIRWPQRYWKVGWPFWLIKAPLP